MDNVTDLSKGLADRMMRDAEELVAKAQMALDQTRAFVEIINNQVAAHAKQNADMVGRFKEAGEVMAGAHRILNGESAANTGTMVTPHRVVERTAPARDPAILRALDDIKRGRIDPAGIGTLPRDLTTDPKRVNDPSNSAGRSELPRAMGGVSQFDPRTRQGEDRPDHSKPDAVDSKPF